MLKLPHVDYTYHIYFLLLFHLRKNQFLHVFLVLKGTTGLLDVFFGCQGAETGTVAARTSALAVGASGTASGSWKSGSRSTTRRHRETRGRSREMGAKPMRYLFGGGVCSFFRGGEFFFVVSFRGGGVAEV